MELFLQTVLSSLSVGAMYALIALGFALILGTLKVVDFAYGAYVLIGGYLTYWLGRNVFTGSGAIDAALSIGTSVVASGLLGMLVWGTVLRPLLDRQHLDQLVGTLGVGVIAGGVILGYFGTDVVLGNFEAARAMLQIGPSYISTGRATGGAIGIVALLLFGLLLRTRVGMMMRAIAADPKGALVVGINTFRLRLFTVALGAGLGGLAGGLLVLFLPLGPSDANRFVLIAFFTVAIGGLGSLRGALIGAFVFAFVEGLSHSYAPNLIKNSIPYLFVGILIALIPRGLGSLRWRFGRSSG